MTQRTFHTTLYSDIAWALMKSFQYNMSYNHYCGSRAGGKLGDSTLKRGDDGEVIFELEVREGYRSWNRTIWRKCRLDDQKIRDELAWLIKCMVHAYAGKDHWSRADDYNLDGCFARFYDTYGDRAEKEEVLRNVKGLTVRDVYCIYEILRNRKNLESKYDPALITKLRGAQFDPVRTELEKAKREQMAEFDRLEQEALSKIRMECERQIDELKKKLWAERDEKSAACRAEYAEKRTELLNQIKMALEFSA